jgi:hypothetical protein
MRHDEDVTMIETKTANELLRSAYAIAERHGRETNWQAFRRNVQRELLEQAGVDFPPDEQIVLRATCTPRNYRLRPEPSKPVDDGWYWYRQTDKHQWTVLEVWRDKGVLWCSPWRSMEDTHNYIENFDGEWYGPIVPPITD